MKLVRGYGCFRMRGSFVMNDLNYSYNDHEGWLMVGVGEMESKERKIHETDTFNITNDIY